MLVALRMRVKDTLMVNVRQKKINEDLALDEIIYYIYIIIE